MKHFISLSVVGLLCACQAKPDQSESASKLTEADKVVAVNMTFDRYVDVDIQNITIVPNKIAPWVSSLFVIDKENTLYRSDIERGDFRPLAKDISDITPLTRDGTPRILFATPTHHGNGITAVDDSSTQDLTIQVRGTGKTFTTSDLEKSRIERLKDNSIFAFQEINDEGQYAAIGILKNRPKEEIKSFCKTYDTQDDAVFILKNNGDINRLDAAINPDNITFNAVKIGTQDEALDRCYVYNENDDINIAAPIAGSRQIYFLDKDTVLYTTSESLTKPRLFLKSKDRFLAIDITGGLTTDAPSRIDSFYVSQDSLGGSLRDGALILADNQSQRLIYISLGFLNMRINEIAADQNSAN